VPPAGLPSKSHIWCTPDPSQARDDAGLWSLFKLSHDQNLGRITSFPARIAVELRSTGQPGRRPYIGLLRSVRALYGNFGGGFNQTSRVRMCGV
jgi:hypothetical protein